MEAGADAKAMEGCCLLAWSSWLVFFLLEPSTTSWGVAQPHWAGPYPNQSLKMPYGFACPILWGQFLSWSCLLSDIPCVVWQTQPASPLSPLLLSPSLLSEDLEHKDLIIGLEKWYIRRHGCAATGLSCDMPNTFKRNQAKCERQEGTEATSHSRKTPEMTISAF